MCACVRNRKSTASGLKRGVFRSVVDLQVAINRFVEETNHMPKPFTWTADPDKIIAAVKRGFYAKSFAGGQVDPATGDFVFGVSEGYLIEGGRLGRPCRGATLIGNCLEALRRIDAVGSDFEMKTGFCGKGGQSVPVGTGQGHVGISELTVGGTEVA